MSAPDAPAPTPEPTPLLVLRVSHDSGRTYGPPRVITTADDLPPLVTSEWPPCECPRHRTR